MKVSCTAHCRLSAATLVLMLSASSSPPAFPEGIGHPPGPSQAVASLETPLAAHRASYNVTLFKAIGSKSPTSARGRVTYEFTGSACDGYSQVFRQMTEMQPAEGATRVSDMRSATFEDAGEKDFSFDVRTTVDGGAPDIVNGEAERKKNDVLAIRLSKPSVQTVDVADDVLFPTAHLKRIIAAAKTGQQILAVKVFDGSDDGKKVYDTTTIIGHPITKPADDPDAAHPATMKAMTRWPVSISYFDEGKKDAGPVYTLGFELYENGVSRALRFDYGDFILAGALSTLELLPDKGCEQPQRGAR